MRLVLRAAAIGLMVAMAAACGSGGSTSASDSEQPKTSSSKPAQPAEPADADTDAKGGGDGSAYCDKVRELGDKQDPLGTLARAQTDPDGKEALKELASIYKELAAVAPGEIKPELEGSRDLFQKVVEANEAGKTSDPELEAQAPKVAEWGVKIQEYTVKHCA